MRSARYLLFVAVALGSTGVVHAQSSTVPAYGSTGPTVPNTRPVDQRLPHPSIPSTSGSPSTPPSVSIVPNNMPAMSSGPSKGPAETR